MNKYHKINSLYKRDEKTGVFLEDFSDPIFEYLYDNHWDWTEKVDGTNIRINYKQDFQPGEQRIGIGGRTEASSIPTFLFNKIQEVFTVERFRTLDVPELTLYGEGYGAKIQKGGGNYKSDGVDFVLFDVRIGDFWLKRTDVDDIAQRLDIKSVPVVNFDLTLREAEEHIKTKTLGSWWGDFTAEGIVGVPACPMLRRNGDRVIVKLKHKDYK